MVEVKGITKVYGDNKAVDNLSFTLEKGKVYGLLGENGAGKSTTMNIMTGYIGATSGTVTIEGHDILREPVKAKKHIGYLPEIPPVYPDMTVEEYLSFAAHLKKVPRKDMQEQIDSLIKRTGLENVRRRLTANLSKGYKQRVGLAAALMGEPDILILDEPTVGLDPVQIIEIRQLIKEYAEEHIVVLSSHILSEVSEICDYVFIISKGKLVADNTVEGLEKGQQAEVRRVHAEVRCVADVLEGVLSKLSEKYTDIEYTVTDANTQPAGVMVEIITPGDTDIREDLFYMCASAKAPIIAMNEEMDTLEDVFIKYTKLSAEEIDALHTEVTDDESEAADDESDTEQEIDEEAAADTPDEISDDNEVSDDTAASDEPVDGELEDIDAASDGDAEENTNDNTVADASDKEVDA